MKTLVKKTISFGKVDYLGIGKKTCPMEVEVEITDRNGKGWELSIRGCVWNHLRTDRRCFGQNIDMLLSLLPHNRKLRRIHEVWKRWHLNGLRAGCRHQVDAGWEDERIDPKELPKSRANRDERGILAIWVKEGVAPPFGKYDEHPKGLLCKPCPVCGYRYGSAWLHEELPAEVIAEVKSW